jgi:hypothetical protein
MTDTTTKLISELDFEAIRNNIAAFIANNSDFTDYNFEGSTLSFLMDVLAFNTHYNALYLNMAVSENFIDTAQLRSSIVSLAKNMGYTPRSATSATAYIQFNINTNPSRTAPTIGPNTLFTSTNNGNTYVFSPTQTYQAVAGTSAWVFSGATGLGIPIREGSYVTQTYTSAGLPNETFIISNYNVDLSSLTVSVQNSATNTTTTSYSLISDITTLTPDTTVYYLWETTDQKYEIQFGDGVLGKILTAGNIVNITYQTSSADAANGCSNFTLATNIGAYTNSNISFTNIVPAFGGQAAESSESIRNNALQNFRTQGRAVTADDYKFFLGRDYPFANSISVWGGEDASPPQYGKVFLSFKPVTGYTLTEDQKQYILSNVIKNYNIVSIIPEIVDPEYTFLQINSTVSYNSKGSLLSSGDIQTEVITAIQNYNDTTLSMFGSNFVYSQFTNVIDTADPSIIGNLTLVTMRKNFPVTLNSTLTYTIDFQNEIHPGSLVNKYAFQAYNDIRLNAGSQNLYLEDDEAGNIRIYTYVGTGSTATKTILSYTAGTVDYAAGIVKLTDFNFSQVNSDGTFDLVANPVDFAIGDITSERNTILTIDPADVTVSVTAK